MVKNSSKNNVFNKLQNGIAREIQGVGLLYALANNTKEQIAFGAALDRMSRIIDRVAAMDDPQLILNIERHCEQFYLASFAETSQEKQSSIQALQTLTRLKTTLAAPLDPKTYKVALVDSVGAHNIGKVTGIPKDDFHLFVKSQNQRLGKVPGQMAIPPERAYFRARKEALKAALKLHEKNCQKALDVPQQNKPSSSQRG